MLSPTRGSKLLYIFLFLVARNDLGRDDVVAMSRLAEGLPEGLTEGLAFGVLIEGFNLGWEIEGG